MYSLFRPFLFRLDPEKAHVITLFALHLAGGFSPLNWAISRIFQAPAKPVMAFGLNFRNPVGLAAGYDKDGVAMRGLAALGFGHMEIGTVTPRPQPGNPKPRIFRLIEDEAVINRMGFPGKGAEAMACRLLHLRRSMALKGTVIGVNLGKNKDTLLESTAQEYISLVQTFAPLADYLVINVSSPNTVGLRRLQGRELLEKLLGKIAAERRTACSTPPILVKIAPDLEDEELDDAIGVIFDTGMDGVIATNTTLARDGLRSRHRAETGGLSGRPLAFQSETLLGRVLKRLNGRLPVISAGGIMTPDDAKRRLDLGAALVQVYTGLIYGGPGLVKEIVKKL